jgi:hypothetical protein
MWGQNPTEPEVCISKQIIVTYHLMQQHKSGLHTLVYCIPPNPNQSCPFITTRFDIIGREVKLLSITNEEERDQKGVTQQNPLYLYVCVKAF